MCSSLNLSIMEKENQNKTLRTSREQIDCYLNFVRVHPEIKVNKNDPSRPKRVEELWSEVSVLLNALKGPTRTPTKWRENLSHWRNQIRSRARKAKAHKMITGGGPSSKIDLTETEQRALDTLGSFAVDGLAELPTIGTEEEVLFGATPTSSPLVTTTDAPIDRTPSSSRTKRITTDDMFENVMTMIKEKGEEERAFRTETLEAINKYSESLNNLATAMVTLTQNIINTKN
ncbi:uncharacterized protein LOC128923560 [Zeugodacus cucurbitae]|uniref:uncharacterized protein LOC128922015 n=1 Tax=Zeugodacus cucurbitae TaxID=28588 RepID=UPI0023D8FAEB|nr:uncharacterized protein LOC128922015 [Zeugodacus cucurbitae]XP_054091812.1 uncharacterized protein LOC128923560 [Zeugodacus cucurbitae]